MKHYFLLEKRTIFYFILLLGFSSCGIKSNLLFRTPTSIQPEAFSTSLAQGNNYVIQKGDYLAISIFPNNGEQIIDQTQDFPVGQNPTLSKGQGGNQQQQNLNNDNGNTQFNLPLRQNNDYPNSYLVNDAGEVNLPQIGKVTIDSLTLSIASELIASKYITYIKNPYVVVQYLNKRVIVMGALGEHVIALRNENMSLYEVIALASGGQSQGGTEVISLQQTVKTDAIRIIRNYKTSPSVLVIDLTTIEGIEQLKTNIQPNDIIYLEPRRKFDRDTISDIGAILSPIASIVTIIIAINAL